MNVMATTLPRRSWSESRLLSCVVSVNSAAGPMWGRESAPARNATPPAQSSATMTHVRPARRSPGLTLPFQLLLELVEKPPVGALRDDLLRAGFDHPGLVEVERSETDRVLGVVLAPFPV